MLSRLLSLVIVAFTYLTTYTFFTPCLVKAPAPIPKPLPLAWKCPDEIEPGEYTLSWGSDIRLMVLQRNGCYSWSNHSGSWVGSWVSSGKRAFKVTECPVRTDGLGAPYSWEITLDGEGNGEAVDTGLSRIRVKVRPVPAAKK